MSTFENVLAWQKAHMFVLAVYKVTRKFPEFEKYGLCSQFQRAAVSVPANIAEGYRKISQADKLRFMNISQGSLEECRYYCILSRDLGYMDLQEYEDLHSRANEVSFLLNACMKGIAENKYKNSIE